MNRLFLLDGFALVFRAYYALLKVPRITSYGKNTNAQLGFTNTLLEIIAKEKPSHLAVAFDTASPTERTAMFPDYKANRQDTPEDLLKAIPDIKNILMAMNIKILEVDGYEADDVIGTVANAYDTKGFEIYIVSQDKDFGQLVNDKIFIYKPAFQKNERKILGVSDVCEQWDIAHPKQVIDILGLMGDSVDNIPGIAGVGEKTAAKLLKEYGSLENILEQADNIKGALGLKIKTNIANATMSKQLATINLHVPIDIHPQELTLKPFAKETLQNIFNQLEFRTLTKRLFGTNDIKDSVATPLFANSQADPQFLTDPLGIESNFKNIHNTTHQYLLIQSEEDIQNVIHTLSSKKYIAIDTETTGLSVFQDQIVGMSLCCDKSIAYYVTFPYTQSETKRLLQLFNPLFHQRDILWIGQNIKFDLNILSNYEIELTGNFYDTMIVQYLLDAESKRSMDFLSMKYLNYQPIEIESLIGKAGAKQKSMRDVEINLLKDYAAEDADITFQLYHYFQSHNVLNQPLQKLFDIEMALIKVLCNMELVGISIDKPYLENMSKEFETKIQSVEEKIYQLSDQIFNIGSPKQLGEVLFEKLKIQSDSKVTKTKTGQYATDDSILEKMIDAHPIIKYVIEFRELSKLKSTYIDALPQMINPHTHRVHTTFSQARAVTGRLASITPNLQNIPIKTEIGSRIRKAFIPRNNNYMLVSADYSQIELRIIAALSNDQNMIEAFVANKDIHTATAAKIYGVNEEDVNKEMRYKAKSVNFGIIYGQGAWGLSQNIKVSKTEAKQLIDNYFAQYPNIKKFMDDQILFARENGYVETLLGRRRWLRDINSANQTVRGFAERNAINMPIQGTAADMIKLAMIKIHQHLTTTTLQATMILQVHDELVFEAHQNDIEPLRSLIQQHMPNALPLPNHVPITISIGTGNNWLEAH